MARTSTYLNFMGNTEAAFGFYRTVFQTEYQGPIMRMTDLPPVPGAPVLQDADKPKIMHIALPITGGHVLMGTDSLQSMGHTLIIGTNVSISLEPDTREEAERLFHALSEGGKVATPLQEMFWGALWGNLTDRYGIQWMVNFAIR